MYTAKATTHQQPSCGTKERPQADIDAFYPNITEELLDNAIEFAKGHVHITDDEINIKGHNSKILNPSKECDKCECESDCPVNGECMKDNIIYQATVTTQNDTYTYTGLSKNTFKQRWIQHMSNFRVFRPIPKTTLSKKIWELKRENTAYIVTWKIIDRASTYTPQNKSCNLCISEIFHIIFKPHNASFNSRNEIKGHCRHWENYRLSKFKT